MSTIDDLRNKVARLRDQLKDAEQKLHAALIAEHPVKVGQQFVNDRGQIGEVTKLAIRYGEPTPILTLLKKDGQLGERTSDLSSWRRWKPRP
jgi:hypothetical protein